MRTITIHIMDNWGERELEHYESTRVPEDHSWITLSNGKERCVYDMSTKLKKGKEHVYFDSYGLEDVPND
jgi:hypothetical protein